MEKQTVWNWSDLNPVCVIRRLLAQLPAIVMAAVAAALLATSVSQLMWHPTYTARATVAVSMKNASYASIYSNLSTTSEIAETMTKLFGGDTFNTLTREQAGSVTGTLTAQVIPETNLLTLTVTDDDPIDAFRSVRFVLENYNLVSDHVFQNVILRELDSPTVPTAPSNPQNLRSLAKKAAIAGAALMTAAVLAVILLSDTVQTSAAVRHKIDARLYGTIHHETKNKTLRTRLHHTNKGLLITMPTAGFYFTEEFGKLASKVSRAVQKDGKKVVMVTSVAENEGKSTVTANLALALARQGKRVLLIDADLHKAALYKLLGAKPTRVLAAILRGKAPCEPEETAQSGLYAIYSTTAQSGASELLSSRGLRSLLEEMRRGYHPDRYGAHGRFLRRGNYGGAGGLLPAGDPAGCASGGENQRCGGRAESVPRPAAGRRVQRCAAGAPDVPGGRLRVRLRLRLRPLRIRIWLRLRLCVKETQREDGGK